MQLIPFLSLVLALTFSVNSWAGLSGKEGGNGDKTGNGGGAQVCYDRANGVKDVKSYDLVEGVYRYDYQIDLDDRRSQKEIEAELWTRLQLSVPGYEAILRSALKLVDAAWTPRAISVDLAQKREEGKDANPILVEEGCKYVQIANWDKSTNKIFVNRSLYARMSPLHRTALRWHEAVYLLHRQAYQVENSDTARRVVGAIFQADSWRIKGLIPWSSRIGVESYLIVRTTSENYLVSMNWPNEADYAPLNMHHVSVKMLEGSGTVLMTPAIRGQIDVSVSYKASLTVANPSFQSEWLWFDGYRTTTRFVVFNKGFDPATLRFTVTSKLTGAKIDQIVKLNPASGGMVHLIW